MSRKKKIIVAIVLTLGAALMAYRFWPMSFRTLVGRDPREATNIACWLGVSSYEPGKPMMSFYSLDFGGEREKMEEVIEILESCEYRRDLRNLWPGGVSGLKSGKAYDGRKGSVFLQFGEWDDYFDMIFVDRSTGLAGNRVVHLTDSRAFERLAEYITENSEPEPVSESQLAGVVQDGVAAGWEIMSMCF